MTRSLFFALMFGAASVRAQTLPDEFAGVRSLGMGGAHRALGTSNDTLYLNPAGMAIMKRYSVEASYAYDALFKLTEVGGSIVDSKSGPVAGGVGYTHERGDGGD